MDIGKRIKQVRTEKNLSMKYLAEKTGYTTASISRWENGKRQPTFEAVCLIAEALGMSIADLVKE